MPQAFISRGTRRNRGATRGIGPGSGAPSPSVLVNYSWTISLNRHLMSGAAGSSAGLRPSEEMQWWARVIPNGLLSGLASPLCPDPEGWPGELPWD